MKDQVRKERAGPEKQLKNAEAEVAKINRDISSMDSKIKAKKGQIKSCNQSKRICLLSKPKRTGCEKRVFGECVIPKISMQCVKHENVPDLPARAVCQANNIKPAAELAAFETARGTLIASREVATKTLEGLRKGLTSIPVELDPRVSGLIVARETAVGTLKAADATVKGFGEFTKILTQGVNAVGKPDIFALEKSSINGSMRGAVLGKPVVLAMNFRMLGKPYYNRFAFSLTDMEFNARQLEVLAIGAATKTVLELGYKAKVVPHSLLDRVNAIYTKKRAAVNAELDEALAANSVDTDDKKGGAGIGSAIASANDAVKQKVEAVERAAREAARKAREAQHKARFAALQKGQQRAVTPGQFCIRASNGRYVTVEGNDKRKVNANRSACAAWETFAIRNNAIYNVTHQTYLSCQQNGNLEGNRTKVGAWERITVKKLSGGKVAFQCQAHGGKYIVAEGGGGREVKANRPKVGAWETFQMIPKK